MKCKSNKVKRMHPARMQAGTQLRTDVDTAGLVISSIGLQGSPAVAAHIWNLC